MTVSVITVTYNSASTIADTMQSVLHQTYEDIEYLIIDGGSTDGTQGIIEEFEPKFLGRLKWISEKDLGIYDAMNKGIRMATGDVIGILNSDDYYTSDDVVANFIPAFLDAKVDAVYGDIHFIHDGSPEKITRYYSSRLFRPFWLRFGFMPAHPSFYVRREVYDKYGYYRTDYKIGSDFEMMVRLFYRHRIKGKYLSKDFVTMRTGGTSNRNLHSRLILIKEDVRACRENKVYSNKLMICTKFFYKIFGFKL
ncbi:MAG: glycosyltransferase [Prevotella sp.]|jgi:glycosyltransferase involved in cell wall biosynthesis|nr:glycosyltransferase [Prevotella sp.]MCI1281175.1 glycosyltransferase [Prevotella sp.]